MKQVIAGREHRREALAGPRSSPACIDGWKNRGLTPDRCRPARPRAFANGSGGKLYAAYQARLKTLNAADFGDLLLETCASSASTRTCSQSYQERFRYILVDEYQDTNVAQYLWLRLLAQGRRNVACVGDDDQSIYGWRGAEVDNILRFEHDFPGATVIRLERNYRSTGHILAAASGLIAHNEGRLGKTLCTEDEPGEKVTHHRRLGLRGGGPPDRRGDRGAAAQGPFAGRDRHPGAHLGPDARDRGALRHARPALPGDRRPALLRARRDPRRPRLSALRRQPHRRPRLRAHRQHAQARPRRRHARSSCTAMPARRRRAADAGRPPARRDRRAEAQAARRPCATSPPPSPAGRADRDA